MPDDFEEVLEHMRLCLDRLSSLRQVGGRPEGEYILNADECCPFSSPESTNSLARMEVLSPTSPTIHKVRESMLCEAAPEWKDHPAALDARRASTDTKDSGVKDSQFEGRKGSKIRPSTPASRRWRDSTASGADACRMLPIKDSTGLESPGPDCRRGTKSVSTPTTCPDTDDGYKMVGTMSLASVENDFRSLRQSLLDPTWPACLRRRGGLEPQNHGMRSNTCTLSHKISLGNEKPSFRGQVPFVLGTPMREHSFVLNPSSVVCNVLDIVGLLVLIYELSSLPLILAWGLPIRSWMKHVAWATLGFWVLDVCTSFRTGFYQHGELVMNPRQIAYHYLKTAFVIDAFCIICDGISNTFYELEFSGGGVEVTRLVRFSKLTRMMRVVGMLRMLRINERLERIMDRWNLPTSARMGFDIARLFVIIMWMTHLITCGWYAIGTGGKSDTGERWVDDLNFEETGMFYQYSTSFHWATTALSSGSMDISPRNSYERQFNVICLVSGLFFSSSLVSSFSAKLTQMTLIQHETTQQMTALVQFLHQAEVSPQLRVRVQKQAKERLAAASGKPMTLQEVRALDTLSLSLRLELQCELSRNQLFTHPLFRVLMLYNVETFRDLTQEAISFVVLARGDVLFLPGQIAEAAFCLSKGTVLYTQEPKSSHVAKVTWEEVHKDTWFSEPALWSHWNHVGIAEAASAFVEGISMIAEKMANVFSRHHLTRSMAHDYTVNFHKRLINAIPPFAPWPNDLRVPHVDFNSILPSLELYHQVLIGLAAIRSLRGTGRTSAEELTDAVHQQRMLLSFNAAGDVEKVSVSVALRLQREDGRILSQLGTKNMEGDESIVPECVLPAARVEQGDFPQMVLERLIDGRLAPFSDRVELSSSADSVDVKDEPSWWGELTSRRVGERCVTTVFHASTGNALDMPTVFGAEATPVSGTGFSRKSSPAGFPRQVSPLAFRRGESPQFFGNRSRAPPREGIHAHICGKTKYYYSWLTAEELDYYGSRDGKPALAQWITSWEGEEHRSSSKTGLTSGVPEIHKSCFPNGLKGMLEAGRGKESQHFNSDTDAYFCSDLRADGPAPCKPYTLDL